MKEKLLKVLYGNETVGSLVMADKFHAAFQYDPSWIKNGFSISPFLLPLSNKLYLGPDKPFFDGLHGVFLDSLPDGWGRLLVDRMLLKHGINPRELSPIERLAIVGKSGMGALSYEPEFMLTEQTKTIDIDKLARDCQRVLAEQDITSIDDLFAKAGSSGGARPKAFVTIDKAPWIVKFPNSQDSSTIGKEEYDYSLCARHCGIEMTETRLLPSKLYPTGIFATKRFDRRNEKRIHMLSVCGLVESSHRTPTLDYLDLVKVTHYLCRNMEEQIKLFKYMCFNVFAHNRDDHSKNFTYLFDDKRLQWSLSPAYDLTYSNSINGWHATTVNNNGENPNLKDILAVAKAAGININKAKDIATGIYEIVGQELEQYLKQ